MASCMMMQEGAAEVAKTNIWQRSIHPDKLESGYGDHICHLPLGNSRASYAVTFSTEDIGLATRIAGNSGRKVVAIPFFHHIRCRNASGLSNPSYLIRVGSLFPVSLPQQIICESELVWIDGQGVVFWGCV